jgi:hypothetical protein
MIPPIAERLEAAAKEYEGAGLHRMMELLLEAAKEIRDLERQLYLARADE